MPHFTPSRMLDRTVDVALVGCGGNGSQMLTGLARLHHAITALGHPGLRVTAWDPDTVSEANMGRQLFSPADVGLHKSLVLVHRLNAFFGLDWKAQATSFPPRHLLNTILICCVDTAKTRSAIAKATEATYIMDLGNRASDGQVVMGEGHSSPSNPEKAPPGHVPLASPYTLFPELIETRKPEDDTPSCGLAEALERQELFVNQAIVTPALSILWEFFRYGRLTWHGAFVNLRTGSMRPLQVQEQSK